MLRTRSFRAALRSNTGAIDLASIMVGVIVIGVIAGIIAATVFAVIPWSQNAAAKQALDSVRTAEAVNKVQASQFTDFSGLRTAGLIQASTSVNAATDATGSCFVAVSRSASGAVFLNTNLTPEVLPVTPTTTTACLSAAELQTLLTSVGAVVPGVPAAAAGYVQTTAGGYGHTAAIDSAGKLWAWGSDTYGQLGNDTALTNQPTPVAVLSTRTFTQVTAGQYHTVALDSTGKLWAWGRDIEGQLGNDIALTNQPTPVAVLSSLTFTQVTAGQYHTVALDSTGKLWAWGADAQGQLGNDTALINQPTPVAVLSSRTFTQVTAGVYHTVALDSTGKLWVWGNDSNGQLGNDTALTDQPTPVAVLSTRTFTQVTAGQYHTVALDSTGKLWTWGSDAYGQLGNDIALTTQPTPVAVLSTRTFTQVAAGIFHTMALDSTGKLWAWGLDAYGQLGNDTALTQQPIPVEVLSSRTFTQVTAGQYHTVALDSAGKLWAWGLDSLGQLGDDTALINQPTPVAVLGW